MKHRTAIFALFVAGSLWGGSVALSKLSLTWLDPSWLSVMRFLVAAPILAVVGRRGLRQAFTAPVLMLGAIGYGAVILLQNAGIDRTSVSHAAIIVGALPVVVALVTAAVGRGSAPRLAWLGYGAALVGVTLVAKGGGGGATVSGDLMVFGSVVLSGAFMAMQPLVLKDTRSRGRDGGPVLRGDGVLAAGGTDRRGSARSDGGSAGFRIPCTGDCRDGAAVLAVRLRAGARLTRVRRRVCEP